MQDLSIGDWEPTGDEADTMRFALSVATAHVLSVEYDIEGDVQAALKAALADTTYPDLILARVEAVLREWDRGAESRPARWAEVRRKTDDDGRTVLRRSDCPIRIDAALYKPADDPEMGSGVNVAERVRSIIASGQTSFRVDNETLVDTDPYPEQEKKLLLTWSRDGKNRVLDVFAQGDRVDLS